MNISKALVSLALVCATISTAHALPADSLYELTINEPGSLTPIYTAKSKISFKDSYPDLSDEQKHYVKRKFHNLGINDTPPYPSNGSGDLYRPLLKVGALNGETGKLLINATIDINGQVSAIEVIESPSDHFANKASQIINNTTFDAANCSGLNCEMNFPIEIQFN